MEKFKVIEAFSGIGSQAKAIDKANLNHWKIINTIEWDVNAIIAYYFIHHGNDKIDEYRKMNINVIDKIIDRYKLSMDGKSPMTTSQRRNLPVELKLRLAAAIENTKNLGSIANLRGEDIEEDFELLTYSFPCQDLSIAGVWHGLNTGINKKIHNRSGMLWEVERILQEKFSRKNKLPRFLLMENVTNILSKRHIGDFKMWMNTLEELGYVNKYYLLNAKDFGIPQNRERVFMISVYVGENKVLRNKISEFLETNVFQYDMLSTKKPIALSSIKEFLRINTSIAKYKGEADSSQPNDTPSRVKIWNDNLKLLNEAGIVTDRLIPTITTKQDRNPNSGVIYYNNNKEGKAKFRYLTPRECFLFMGFEESDFDRIIDNNFQVNTKRRFFTNAKLIKMAGNSIVVDILVEIFKQIDEMNDIVIQEEYIEKCI